MAPSQFRNRPKQEYKIDSRSGREKKGGDAAANPGRVKRSTPAPLAPGEAASLRMATNLSDTYCICGEEHGELTECVEGEKCRGGGWFHKVCAIGSSDATACEEENTYVCPLCVVRRALLPPALRYHDKPWLLPPAEQEQSDEEEERDFQESSLAASVASQEGESARDEDGNGASPMEEDRDELSSTSEEEEEEEEGGCAGGCSMFGNELINKANLMAYSESAVLFSHPLVHPLGPLLRSDRGARRQHDPAVRRERRPPQVAHAEAKAATATEGPSNATNAGPATNPAPVTSAAAADG